MGVREQAEAAAPASAEEARDAAPPYDRRLNRGVGKPIEEKARESTESMPEPTAGCRCRSDGGGSPFAAILLLGLLRRRRKPRR
jgi:MYXO-CTERM domain-containing protein